MRESAIQSKNLPVYPRLHSACLLFAFACMEIAFACPAVRAQESPQKIATEATPRNSAPIVAERYVSWRTLPRNFFHDQKDIWLFPLHVTRGQQWLPHARCNQ